MDSTPALKSCCVPSPGFEIFFIFAGGGAGLLLIFSCSTLFDSEEVASTAREATSLVSAKSFLSSSKAEVNHVGGDDDAGGTVELRQGSEDPEDRLRQLLLGMMAG